MWSVLDETSEVTAIASSSFCVRASLVKLPGAEVGLGTGMDLCRNAEVSAAFWIFSV